jgi:hypothetical protein
MNRFTLPLLVVCLVFAGIAAWERFEIRRLNGVVAEL